MTHFPESNLSAHAGKHCRGDAVTRVGELLQQRTGDALSRQYLRDLDTLDRIERQREEAGEPGLDFFEGMGEVIARRTTTT